MLAWTGHFRSRTSPDDVDLCPYAKVIEIQTRLNRESAAGQELALIVRFVVVQMSAVAVHGFPQTVSSAMEDVAAIAGRVNDCPRRAIQLEAANVSTGSRLVGQLVPGSRERLDRRWRPVQRR